MFCFYHCFDDYTKAKNSWHMPFSACLDKINPCDCSGKQTNFPLNHTPYPHGLKWILVMWGLTYSRRKKRATLERETGELAPRAPENSVSSAMVS
jgi:hypothetical protein